jgi:hypothetical protein
MGELWIKNIVASAQEILAQPSITSDITQTIFQSYNKTSYQSSHQDDNNEFEKFADVVKSHASQLRSFGLDVFHNSKDLHVAIAAVVSNTGQDVETILQQSPACRTLTPQESEALVSGWIEDAQSIITATHSAPITKDNQSKGFQL